MVATAGAADSELLRYQRRRTVTLMRGFADTTRMRSSSRRQRKRNKSSGKSEHQQKSGGQSLHVSSVKQNPKTWVEHKAKQRNRASMHSGARLQACRFCSDEESALPLGILPKMRGASPHWQYGQKCKSD